MDNNEDVQAIYVIALDGRQQEAIGHLANCCLPSANCYLLTTSD